MKRESLLTEIENVVDAIDDGDTVAIGGFLTSHKPMACIRELIRRNISNLTVISPPTSLETDLLIAEGCVDRVITPYVGAEAISSIAPWFRHRAEHDQISVVECDGGMVVTALEAAKRNLPFMPWRGGVGTDIPTLNDELAVFEDPIEGQTLVAVPAIEPNVALLHCPMADMFGNVQSYGDTFSDSLIIRASEESFVQVEEVIANDEVRRNSHRTLASSRNVDGIIEAPYGSHPFSCEGYYTPDRSWLEEYVESANQAIDGDGDRWTTFLDKYVHGPSNHFDYLDCIGFEQLTTLHEYGMNSK